MIITTLIGAVGLGLAALVVGNTLVETVKDPKGTAKKVKDYAKEKICGKVDEAKDGILSATYQKNANIIKDSIISSPDVGDTLKSYVKHRGFDENDAYTEQEIYYIIAVLDAADGDMAQRAYFVQSMKENGFNMTDFE